jgi:hypothetical protein
MRYFWIYFEIEGSRPTLYGTALTRAEAHDMCKGFHSYRRLRFWDLILGVE